jgi:Protein of unknown function (DUF429)
MKVMGIDFTSRPKRRKPLTCLHCTIEGRDLHADHLQSWSRFSEFEDALQAPGPWIAGIDFPFGQSRKFLENVGWPCQDWASYVTHAGSLGRDGFRNELEAYRAPRQKGDREHRRRTDEAASSISPQKLYGVPVGLMFFEGAPRLVGSGVTIPVLQLGDPQRIVVEAYPGVLARQLVEREKYKDDDAKKQTKEQHECRHKLLNRILNGQINSKYGLRIQAQRQLIDNLADDPTGDRLDALLCAIQAAWAWTMKESGYGAPQWTDPLEGWIADPSISTSHLPH